MQEEKKPPDEVMPTTNETQIIEEHETANIFPLKTFEDTLERAREISKKYSEDHIADPEE